MSWLEGVQKAMEGHLPESLLKLELKLKKERKENLLQKEMLWMQKSHCNWLKSGNGNIKFFHTSALIRKRRNIVEALLNDHDELVEDREELKNLTLNFYEELFRSDPNAGREFISGKFPQL